MVQIIRRANCYRNDNYRNLYIPHGSDNTKGLWCLKLNFFIFISHMVQIILLRPYAALWQYEELYIPHGSDNTTMKQGFSRISIRLYIPHGSDNTLDIYLKPFNVLFFISHMVQIILKQETQRNAKDL